jgi:homoserine kinase type II
MATFTQLSADDGARIAQAHGLGRCLAVIPVSAGTVNSNYFLETEAGRVFVRLYEQQDVEGVRYEWQLLDHLEQRAVPVPPRVHGPAPGELRVGGKPVAVFRAVSGDDLCQKRVTETGVNAVGVALARANKAGEDFPVVREGRFTLADVVRLLGQAANAQRPELVESLARLSALANELQQKLPQLPRGVIHGDLFRDNVLWQGDQLVALLDWESASHGVVAYDVAVTVLAWCCGDTLDWTLARALVTGYRSERALHDEEWTGLWWMMRMACLRFATTRIVDVHLRGGYPAGYKDFRRFLLRLDAVESMSADELAQRLGR